MGKIETNKIFDNKAVRVVFDDERLEWYFSILDVVEVLAHSSNPTDYLKKMRRRDPELAKGWGQIVTPLAVETAGGRQRTNFATKEGVFRIIQSISSPKEEQFRQWVEQITSESSQAVNKSQLSAFEDVHGEILLYQPDETVRLEVLMENETVWLTQAQIIELFQSSKSNISEHITNIYEQGELVYEATVRNFRTVQKEGERMVNRELTYYNLDAIISIGFRVNAKRGIRFRQWANGIIKNYLLRGYAINQQLLHVEQRLENKLDTQQKQIQKIESTLTDHQEKIDFFVRTNQRPVEGIFYDGQIFDAYRFASDLIRKAKRAVVLIDNYIDDTVLTMLDKRDSNVSATIYTQHVSQQFQLDLDRHNAQYAPITVQHFNRAHDRFLIVDEEVYQIGASLKDLGKKWFAFTLMNDITATELIRKIHE